METNQRQPAGKFTQGYTFKILLLFGLVLLLLIPLAMIRGLIRERNQTANSAEAEIMEAWGSRLIQAGPFIVIPGIRTEEIRSTTERDGEKIDTKKHPFALILTPQKLNIGVRFNTEIRKRGIFSVPLFSGELALSGTFSPSEALATLSSSEEVFFDQSELIIALTSQKGIRKINSSKFNNRDMSFQPGNRGLSIDRLINPNTVRYDPRLTGSGIFASLPDFSDTESVFDINIAIQGGKLVRFLPIGKDTHTEISADWPSPSFQGTFLPGSSIITDENFEAVWDISYLSRDIPLFWKTENNSNAGSDYYPESHYSALDYSDSMFGVNFFRAIDTYSLNTRAVKYSILFLAVPFLTLFLFEIFSKKRIHPVPYLLSGIANIIFYLLLLSLSEQMPFFTAYLVAAFGVTVMMTLYSRSLIPSWNKSWYMGLVVIVSYVLLYAVLNAESYALLIGSIGAFMVIGLVMFLTRKLDWYGSGGRVD